MKSSHRVVAIGALTLAGSVLGGCPEAPRPDAGRDTGMDVVAIDTGADIPIRDASDAAVLDVYREDVGPVPSGCHLLDAAVDVLPTFQPDAGDAATRDASLLDPAGYPPLRGPGGPSTIFTRAQLNVPCAYLNGGPTDQDHHNTVLMIDGYLVMPWAHERGAGGVSVWEFTDPCNPVPVATAIDAQMRESHTAGFSFIGGRWMVTASLTGIQFWDIADFRAMRMVRDLALPGVSYPDAYRRVVLSTFWQAPYVYVAGADNGIFIVDATDPRNPVLVRQYVPQPTFRVTSVQAVGNLLVAFSTEGSRTTLLDIGDPTTPRDIPGGSFLIHDGTFTAGGTPRYQSSYSGHMNGNRTYYARNILGGGLIAFDISNPSRPAFLGNYLFPGRANGGYVFVKEDVAFVGLSNFAQAIDISDPTRLTPITTINYTGDFDTVSPIGNAVVVSVDDDAVHGQATGVLPYAEMPDRRAPRVNMVVPRDGTSGHPLTTRVGVTFDEFVDMHTVWRGSFQLRVMGSTEPVEGYFSGQETVVNFWPAHPLRPNTTYEIFVPAGGVRDYSGNATNGEFRAVFTTIGCP